jgi:hypothetical protein
MILATIDVQHDQRLRAQPFALGLSTGGTYFPPLEHCSAHAGAECSLGC